ncbi:D-alanyl-D-alanine carboxypeptidase [Paenibacillus pinisoli]|uniref:D-alanyl-D-alanine carboxypeptidase n=1 Tax=Paenibacillus pinisoli TaxID=1276110 RepID=A0A3A6PJD8_9BACL|nr:D-alanyl-D-alanine carboxypeptidase family protein [Paenibacillus pinisoli]RJX41355.1 D-alanyl-D-alanine carboxypeptidase [Paenibacillus pinisoli]
MYVTVKAKPRYGIRLTVAAAVVALVYIGAGWLKDGYMKRDVLQLSSASAILIDATTGEIIFEKNANQPLPPASMSKMMTEILVLDAVAKGEARWSDMTRASGYAEAVPGARMGLIEGQEVTVRELFDAMTIHSANDAAVALAEHLAGSEEAFVARMNEKAAAIGLSDGAVFGNASGLSKSDIAPYAGSAHARDTLLTAKDTAIIAGHLIGKYPEVLAVTSRSSVNVSTQRQTLSSTNLMLTDKQFAYPGNDGLKTGYTPSAGYCFTGTVKRDHTRLISVVMGADNIESRFQETIKLYDYGFQVKGKSGLRTALGF